jgi:hypothetical protein
MFCEGLKTTCWELFFISGKEEGKENKYTD